MRPAERSRPADKSKSYLSAPGEITNIRSARHDVYNGGGPQNGDCFVIINS